MLISLRVKAIHFLFLFCIPFLTTQKGAVTSGYIMTGTMSFYVFTAPDALRPSSFLIPKPFVDNKQGVKSELWQSAI